MNNQNQPQLLLARIMVEPDIAPIMHELAEKLPEVFRHSINVAYLTAEICYSELGNELVDVIDNKIDTIKGALLHDIGKLDIPIDVLHKTETLTDEDIALIHKHPIFGYNRIKNKPGFSNITKEIILHHHEKLDGSGYPHNIKKINYCTQLVAFADMYDALTENRPYRAKKSLYDTYQILNNEHLNSDLFLMLVSCLDR